MTRIIRRNSKKMVKARLNTTYLTDKIHYQEMLTGANGSDLKRVQSIKSIVLNVYTVHCTVDGC